MSFSGQNRSGNRLPVFVGLLPPSSLTTSLASQSSTPAVVPLHAGRVPFEPFGGQLSSVNLPVGSQIYLGIPIPVMAVAPFQPDAASPPSSIPSQGKERDSQSSLRNQCPSISASSSTVVGSPARVISSHAVMQNTMQTSTVFDRPHSSPSMSHLANSSLAAKHFDPPASESSLNSSCKHSLDSSSSSMQNIKTDTSESMHLLSMPKAEFTPNGPSMNLRSNTNRKESAPGDSVRQTDTGDTVGSFNDGISEGSIPSQKKASSVIAVVSEAELIKQAFTLKCLSNPVKTLTETIPRESLSVPKAFENPHDFSIKPNSVSIRKLDVELSNVGQSINESAVIRQAFTLKQVTQSGLVADQTFSPCVPSVVHRSASSARQLPAFSVLLPNSETSRDVRNAVIEQSKPVPVPAVKDYPSERQVLTAVHPLTSVIHSSSFVCNSAKNVTSNIGGKSNSQNGKCYLCSNSELECSDRAVWKHVLEKHVVADLAKGVGTEFFCTHCHQPQQNFAEVKIHEALYHQSQRQCFFCGFSLANVVETDDTQAWNHVLGKHCVQYSCAICDGKFLTKSGLEKHCKESGHFTLPNFQRQTLICPLCHMYFDSKNFLKHHLLTIHSFWKHSQSDQVSTEFECASCNTTFLTEEALAFHRTVNSKDLNSAPEVEESDLAMFAYKVASRNVAESQRKSELKKAATMTVTSPTKTSVEPVKNDSAAKSSHDQAVAQNVVQRHETILKISETVFRNSKKNKDDRNFVEKAMSLDPGLDESRLLSLGYDRKLSDRQLCQSLRHRPGQGHVEEYYSLCNLSYFCFVDCQNLPLPEFLSIVDAIYGHAVCEYQLLKPFSNVIKSDEILVLALAVSRSEEFAKLLREHNMPQLEMSVHVMQNLAWALQFRNSLLSRQQLKMGPQPNLQQLQKDSDHQKASVPSTHGDSLLPSNTAADGPGTPIQTSATKQTQMKISKFSVEKVIAKASSIVTVEHVVTEEVSGAKSINTVASQSNSCSTGPKGKTRRRGKQHTESSSEKKQKPDKTETKKRKKVVPKDFTPRKSYRQRKEKYYNEDVMWYYSDEDFMQQPFLPVQKTNSETPDKPTENPKVIASNKNDGNKVETADKIMEDLKGIAANIHDVDKVEAVDKTIENPKGIAVNIRDGDTVESSVEVHTNSGSSNSLETTDLETYVHVAGDDDEDTVPAIDSDFEERVMDVAEMTMPVLEKKIVESENVSDELNGIDEHNAFEPVVNLEKDGEYTEREIVEQALQEESGILLCKLRNEEEKKTCDERVPVEISKPKRMLTNNKTKKLEENVQKEKTDETEISTPKKNICKSRKRKPSSENIDRSATEPTEPTPVLEILTINTTNVHEETSQHSILSPRSRIQNISPKSKTKMRNLNYDPWCVEMKKKHAVEALSAQSERIRKKLIKLEDCSLVYFDDRIKCCYVKLLKIDGGLDELDPFRDGLSAESKKRRGRKRKYSSHPVEPIVQAPLAGGRQEETAVSACQIDAKDTAVGEEERPEGAVSTPETTSNQPLLKKKRGRQAKKPQLSDVLVTSSSENICECSTAGVLADTSENTVKKKSVKPVAKTMKLSEETPLGSVLTATVSPVPINKVENKAMASSIHILESINAVVANKQPLAQKPVISEATAAQKPVISEATAAQKPVISEATATTSVLTMPVLLTGPVTNLFSMNSAASPHDMKVITSSMIPQSILQQFSGLLNSLGESTSERPSPPTLLTASVSSMVVFPHLPPPPALIKSVAMATRTETQSSQGCSAQVLQTGVDSSKKLNPVNQSVSNCQYITINPLVNIKKEKIHAGYEQSNAISQVAPSISSIGAGPDKSLTTSQENVPVCSSSAPVAQSSAAVTETVATSKPTPAKDSGVKINPLVNIKKEKYDQGYEASLKGSLNVSAHRSQNQTSTVTTLVHNPSRNKSTASSAHQVISLNKASPALNQPKPQLGPDQHVKINPLINIKKEKYDAGYGASQTRPGPRPPSLKASSASANPPVSTTGSKILPPDQIVHINPLINIKKEKYDKAYERFQTPQVQPRFVAPYPSPMLVPGFNIPPTPVTTSAALVTSMTSKTTESDILAGVRKSMYDLLFGSGSKGTPVTLTYSSQSVKTTTAAVPAIMPGSIETNTKTTISSDLNPFASKFPATVPPNISMFPISSKIPTPATPLYPTSLAQNFPTPFTRSFPHLVPDVPITVRSHNPPVQASTAGNWSANPAGSLRTPPASAATFSSSQSTVSTTTSKKMFAPDELIKINPLLNIKKEKFDAGYQNAGQPVSAKPSSSVISSVPSTASNPPHTGGSAAVTKDQHVKINPLINIKQEKYDPEYQKSQNKSVAQSFGSLDKARTCMSTVSISYTTHPTRGDGIRINPVLNIKKEKHDTASTAPQYHQTAALLGPLFPVQVTAALAPRFSTQVTAPLAPRFSAQVTASLAPRFLAQPRMSKPTENQTQSNPGKILPPDQIVNINPLINIKKEHMENSDPVSSLRVLSAPQYGTHMKSNLANVQRQSTAGVHSGSPLQLPVSAHSSSVRQPPLSAHSSSARQPSVSVNSSSPRQVPISVHNGSPRQLPVHSSSPRQLPVSAHSGSPRQTPVPAMSPQSQEHLGIMNNLLSILKDIHEQGRQQAAQQVPPASLSGMPQVPLFQPPGPPAFNASPSASPVRSLIRDPMHYTNPGNPGYSPGTNRVPQQLEGHLALASFLVPTVPRPIIPPSAHQQKPQSFVVRNPASNSAQLQHMSAPRSQGHPGVMSSVLSNQDYRMPQPPYPIPAANEVNGSQYGPKTPPLAVLPKFDQINPHLQPPAMTANSLSNTFPAHQSSFILPDNSQVNRSQYSQLYIEPLNAGAHRSPLTQWPPDYTSLPPAHTNLDQWSDFARSPLRPGGQVEMQDRTAASARYPQSPAGPVHPAFPSASVMQMGFSESPLMSGLPSTTSQHTSPRHNPYNPHGPQFQQQQQQQQHSIPPYHRPY